VRLPPTLLFLVCIAAVIAKNLQLWHRDCVRADALRSHVPAPVSPRSTPQISALVAAWNPGEDLPGLIESFRAIDYADKELILAVGGAHRRQDLGHLEGDDVRLIEHPGGGKQRALARCLEKASGEVIYLTDADCILDSDGFLRLVAPIVNGEVEATSGRSVPLPEQRNDTFVLHQWAGSLYQSSDVQRPVSRISGRNCALSRRVLEAAGRFDADVPIGTDLYLGEKLGSAGCEIWFIADSEVQSRFHCQLLPYIRQQSRWIRNLTLHGLGLGQPRHVIGSMRTSLTGLGMIGLTALAPFSRPAAAVLLPLLLHGYLKRLRQLGFARRAGRITWRNGFYPSALLHLYVEFVAWATPLFEYPSGEWRRRW
jgi:hypothetical protein